MIAAIVLAAAVQIQATDYALSLPSIIPSGLNTFRFENKGAEPHYVRFVRIDAPRFSELAGTLESAR